ncbi:Uncharacterised protein [Mycobacterium tuberculosis]|nr:Uncharacterised protein [Mycobacterium tuberculosis]
MCAVNVKVSAEVARLLSGSGDGASSRVIGTPRSLVSAAKRHTMLSRCGLSSRWRTYRDRVILGGQQSTRCGGEHDVTNLATLCQFPGPAGPDQVGMTSGADD